MPLRKGWHLYSYAILLTSLDRLADAGRLHAEVLDARLRMMGERHPGTLDSMCAVAGVAALRGDSAAAIRLVARAVELGYSDAGSLLSDSDFESPHDDPALRALAERARSASPPPPP